MNAVELEKMTGVPSRTIYRLLNEPTGNPTLEVLKKISSFFQVSVSQLIGEESIGTQMIPLLNNEEMLDYINGKISAESFKHISVDIPLSNNCFATVAQDETMEPFIPIKSILVVDPSKEPNNRDFVLLIETDGSSKIRQIITDGRDRYVMTLNPNFQKSAEPLIEYSNIVVAPIVHYRTNLFDISSNNDSLSIKLSSSNTVK